MLDFKTEHYIGTHNYYAATVGLDLVIKVTPTLFDEKYWIMEITTPEGKKLCQTKFKNNPDIPKETQFANELQRIGLQRIKRWDDVMEKIKKARDQNVNLWKRAIEQAVKDDA